MHEAKLDEQLRLKAAASGDKMTEVMLKAAIRRDPKRVEIVDKVADAERDERLLNALAYAFAQRKDLLIALGRSRNVELAMPSEMEFPEELGQLDPPLVFAVGRRAWHKMGGEGGILKANAKVVYGRPTVVACVHPAAVLRDPALLPEMERAVRKFAKLFKALRSRGKEVVTSGRA